MPLLRQHARLLEKSRCGRLLELPARRRADTARDFIVDANGWRLKRQCLVVHGVDTAATPIQQGVGIDCSSQCAVTRLLRAQLTLQHFKTPALERNFLLQRL